VDVDVKHYYKIASKKMIKLHTITDSNNVILSYAVTNPHIHDSKMVKPLINKLTVNLKSKAYLIADAGYCRKQTVYRGKQIKNKNVNKNVKLIYAYKRTAKKKHSLSDKKLLNKRYIVEQSYGHLTRTYNKLLLIFNPPGLCPNSHSSCSQAHTKNHYNAFVCELANMSCANWGEAPVESITMAITCQFIRKMF
jgi:hypothetical protein